MKRFLLYSLLGLASCGLGSTPFVQVTVIVPPGVVTPEPEILEFTVTTEEKGETKEDITQVNVSELNFPMSVNLTFERNAKRQPVHIVVKGFAPNNPTELFFAEGDSEVGDDFLELTAQYCGNGITEAARGEECDDGNLLDGDECSASCLAAVCGNNIVESGENCEDGNTLSGDGCSSACQQEFCGDGVANNALSPEACDDGNAVEGDGCDSNCTVSACGNEIIASNEVCLEPAALISVSIVEPTDLAFGDFDGDGADDIAVSSSASGQSRVTVLFNRGLSGFVKEGSDILVNSANFTAIAVGDFETDGDIDIVVSDATNDSVRLIENNGAGTFTLRAASFLTGNAPQDIVVEDVDRNGFDDIITANGVVDFVGPSSTGDVSVIFNLGSTAVASFNPRVTLNANAKAQTSTVTGNFHTKNLAQQTDETIDIVTASSSLVQQVAKFDLFNTIEGATPSFFVFDTELLDSTTISLDQANLASADIDGDGNPDLIVTHSGSDSAEFFLGALDGSLTKQPNALIGARAFDVFAGDFNGDGAPDFATLGGVGDAAIRVVVNDGSGSFSLSGASLTGSSRNKAIVAKDINNDGIDDLFVAGGSGNTIHIFLSNP